MKKHFKRLKGGGNNSALARLRRRAHCCGGAKQAANKPAASAESSLAAAALSASARPFSGSVSGNGAQAAQPANQNKRPAAPIEASLGLPQKLGKPWLSQSLQKPCGLARRPLVQKQRRLLLKWFEKAKRPLPWRSSRNPYNIWVSEALLQQTTAAAARPFYRRFLKAFPDLRALSNASQEEIYAVWRGLGYYKRADCMLKAAKLLQAKGRWPRVWLELRALPGFGPYMSRAVSSLAFGEAVGVLDGNVIRFLSRFYGLSLPWQTAAGRRAFQELADRWASARPAYVNQALMEIGSLVCRPKNPLCNQCPVRGHCRAFRFPELKACLPLKKPPMPLEICHYKPLVISAQRPGGNASGEDVFALREREDIPFLKGKPMFEGAFRRLKAAPKRFHFCHSITRYKIYVTVQTASLKSQRSFRKSPLREAPSALRRAAAGEKAFSWIPLSKLSGQNPSSLAQKIIKQALK